MYTACRYLWDQGTDSSRHIATILSLCDVNFESTGQYSNRWNCFWADAILTVPMANMSLLTSNVKEEIEKTFYTIFPSATEYDLDNIIYTPKIESAYEDWRRDIQEGAVGSVNNHASFKTSGVPMCEFKNMKFRSKSELRVAEVLVEKNVLFFPLPLAVAGKNHREPDFLICLHGKWAILEVVSDYFHPSVEKDAKRTQWFQDHNITIRSYSAKECYNNPERVVNDFSILVEKTKGIN